MITLILTTDEATKVLATITGNLENLTPVMEQARDVLMASVKENFVQGGRPTPWAPLRPPRTGIPLVGSRGLLNSITAEVTPTSVTLQSDLPYSAIHQYGGTISVPERVAAPHHAFRFVTAAGETVFARRIKAHSVVIPARPYLVSQQSDEDALVAIAEQHVVKGVQP
jgi:phage gpG-like protein